jgi:DNA repair exonuclease SbcCD ATPase subunit
LKSVDFHNLALQGFRSFKKDTVFPFPKRPGFYLLDGDNGAGKSSIWGGLAWVLYGKTDRGLKAGTVANWEQTELTSVVVEFSVNGKEYALTRTWNPNSLNIEKGDGEPRPITQEEVDTLLGLDYQGFLNTVLISQFADTFFDLEATDRLRVFGDALELTFWEEKGDLARKKAKEWGVELDTHVNELVRNQGKLESLRETRKRLKSQLADSEEERITALSKARGDKTEWEGLLEKAQNNLTDTKRRVGIRQVKLERLEAVMARKTAKEREAETEVNRIRGVIAACKRDIERLEKHQEELKGLKGKCPTCEQFIKTGHTKVARERLQKEIEWEQGEIGRQRDKLSDVKDRHRELLEELTGLATEHSELEERLRDARNKEAKWRGDVRECSNRVESLATEIKHLEKESPLERELSTVRHQFMALQAEIADDIVAVDEMKARVVGLEKWATLFKELRLWLIEEALAELEVEVNNALIQLGLEEWTVSFEVEKENKSGGVTKGFHVLIEAPESNGAVPWKAWSGGETQRLRIAGAMGLSAVIRGRRGIKPTLEVWDEPTTFIQEEGIQGLLTFLQARARDEKRQVWLIDHRSLTFGFDGHVTVEKDEEGSHVLVRKGDR